MLNVLITLTACQNSYLSDIWYCCSCSNICSKISTLIRIGLATLIWLLGSASNGNRSFVVFCGLSRLLRINDIFSPFCSLLWRLDQYFIFWHFDIDLQPFAGQNKLFAIFSIKEHLHVASQVLWLWPLAIAVILMGRKIVCGVQEPISDFSLCATEKRGLNL
jgi:hypothetical protein